MEFLGDMLKKRYLYKGFVVVIESYRIEEEQQIFYEFYIKGTDITKNGINSLLECKEQVRKAVDELIDKLQSQIKEGNKNKISFNQMVKIKTSHEVAKKLVEVFERKYTYNEGLCPMPRLPFDIENDNGQYYLIATINNLFYIAKKMEWYDIFNKVYELEIINDS